MAYVNLIGYMCERCSYIWAPKHQDAEEPKRCPKCSTTEWNKPRQKGYVEVRANGRPRSRPPQGKAALAARQEQAAVQEAER